MWNFEELQQVWMKTDNIIEVLSIENTRNYQDVNIFNPSFSQVLKINEFAFTSPQNTIQSSFLNFLQGQGNNLSHCIL